MVPPFMSSFHSNERAELPARSKGNSGFAMPRKTTLWSPPAQELPHHSVPGKQTNSPSSCRLWISIDGGVPVRFRDLEVVGGVAEHVEPGDVAAVGQVVFGIVDADRVLGVDVEVGEPGAQCCGRVINAKRSAGFRYVGKCRNAGCDLDFSLAARSRDVELDHSPRRFWELPRRCCRA